MEQITIPDKKAAPKEKDTDSSTGIPNWADNEKTVTNVLGLIRQHFGVQKAQGQRRELEVDMRDADQMARMSTGQTKQSVDLTDDSDNIPHVFMAMNRMVTAYETDIAFPAKESPGKFVPLDAGDEIMRQMARDVCDQRNLLLEYSMETDNRKAVMKNGWHFDNQYGNGFYSMEWMDVQRSVRYRMIEQDDEGKTTKIGWKTKKVDESHPHLVRWNLRNVWMDSNIDAIQDQNCINLLDYPTLSTAVSEQAAGHYKNVGLIKKENMYDGESHSHVKADRQTDSGGASDVDTPTGNLVRHTAFVRAPINEKGVWDEKGTYPTWHWVAFIGDIESSEPICVRLNPNPFNEKDWLPMYMQHTHPDDKGAYHRGYVNMVRPAHNEYKTVLNQWFELKNQKCAAPWLVEAGALLPSNKDFHPKRMWNVVKGAISRKMIDRLDVDVNTQDMIEFIRYLEQKVRDIYAVQKSFEGVAMGGRTSAQEAKNAMDQSTKPAMAKLRYMSGLIEWMAETDAKLWEQFAKPEQIVAITRGELIHEIKPAELWGRFSYKVTSIDEFETNTLQRQEFDRWFQVYGPVAMETMPSEGRRNFLKDALKGRPGFDSDKYWPPEQDSDARKNAKQENLDMLRWDEMGEAGEWREPQEGENFDLHIDMHKNDLAIYKVTAGANPENVKTVQAHIEMTEQMKKQSQAAIQSGAQQASNTLGQESGAAPALGDGSAQTDAQAGGDLLAAGEGVNAL